MQLQGDSHEEVDIERFVMRFEWLAAARRRWSGSVGFDLAEALLVERARTDCTMRVRLRNRRAPSVRPVQYRIRCRSSGSANPCAYPAVGGSTW